MIRGKDGLFKRGLNNKMRQADIERFEKIVQYLPDVLEETEENLRELGEAAARRSSYWIFKTQLLEMKQMIDRQTIPTKADKEKITMTRGTARALDGAEEWPEYAKKISTIVYLYSKLGGAPEFKYFGYPKDEARYVRIPCQCCGGTDYCLDGRYFGQGKRVKSACAFCLAEGKCRVAVPEDIKIKLLNHLRQVYPDKPESEIRETSIAKVDELERTPPVPWLTQNEWPVANGDFTEYRLIQDDFFEGKEDFFKLVAGIEKVRDKEELWKQMGRNIKMFVFSVIGAREYTKVVVPQSLNRKTIKRVWGES